MSRLLAGFVLLLAAGSLAAEEPREVIERAVKAMGGTEAVKQPLATRFHFKGTVTGIPIEGGITGTFSLQPPDGHRMQMKIALNMEKAEGGQAVKGGKGWRQQVGPPGVPADVKEMTQAELDWYRTFMHEERVRLVLPLLQDNKFRFAAQPDADVKGQPAAVVKASYPGQPDVTLFFDKGTHLLVKVAYKAPQNPGADGDVLHETYLSDYREVCAGAAEVKALTAAGLGTDGPALVAFLRKQVPEPGVTDRVRRLIRQLADDDFEARERAGADLVAVGAAAVPMLQEAAKDDDAEVARRAKLCLERITARADPALARSAVRLLGLRAPEGAAAALLAYLPAADAATAVEVRAALAGLAQRPGGPDPVLTKALEDSDPVRRAAAAAVLGRDGGAYLGQPGRRLLFPGLRLPTKVAFHYEGKPNIELDIAEFELLNRIDDKEFTKP